MAAAIVCAGALPELPAGAAPEPVAEVLPALVFAAAAFVADVPAPPALLSAILATGGATTLPWSSTTCELPPRGADAPPEAPEGVEGGGTTGAADVLLLPALSFLALSPSADMPVPPALLSLPLLMPPASAIAARSSRSWAVMPSRRSAARPPTVERSDAVGLARPMASLALRPASRPMSTVDVPTALRALDSALLPPARWWSYPAFSACIPPLADCSAGEMAVAPAATVPAASAPDVAAAAPAVSDGAPDSMAAAMFGIWKPRKARSIEPPITAKMLFQSVVASSAAQVLAWAVPTPMMR